MKKLKWIDEFRTFVLRGNVIDMAVGIIVGGAFQNIVKSLIDDLVMPFVGLLTGGINFVDQFMVLRLPEGVPADTVYQSLEAAKAAGATTFNYGSFITGVINFLIMAFVVFLLIKLINRISSLAKKKEDVVEEATTKTCPFCCSEIDINASRCPHCTSVLTEE